MRPSFTSRSADYAAPHLSIIPQLNVNALKAVGSVLRFFSGNTFLQGQCVTYELGRWKDSETKEWEWSLSPTKYAPPVRAMPPLHALRTLHATAICMRRHGLLYQQVCDDDTCN